VDNLGWVMELIEAPDLESLGIVLEARLGTHVERGAPTDERRLAERCAFEHEVRRYLSRAQERGYAYQARFPRMPSLWVDFVDQNKLAESNISRLAVRRTYEAGRMESTEAANKAWMPATTLPAVAQSQVFDPITMIDRLIQDAIAQRLPQLPPPQASPLVPVRDLAAFPQSGVIAESTSRRMSEVLVEFLKPLDRKRQHTVKGRGEAEPVIQFAVDILSNPRMNELTEAQWKLLDEALPDIPNRDNIPRKFSKTLFQRYKYAEDTDWSKLERVTTTTIKSRYWAGLYKFVDFAIAEKLYSGARPKFVCIDPENLAPLPRDAFDDDELLKLLRMPLFTGCKNRVHVWQPGGYFVQSHIYWGFLICILTGMRPGEVGQLKCADIRTDGAFYYFDMRPFDARNGRVAVKDLRNLTLPPSLTPTTSPDALRPYAASHPMKLYARYGRTSQTASGSIPST